jgi:hypothetical protein
VLVQQPDCLRPYYGPLVGHRTEFIRDFSAQTFSYFFRKLQGKQYRSHLKKLMKALASSCRTADGMEVDSVLQLPVNVVEGKGRGVADDDRTDLTPRVQDLLGGVAQLLFATFKGVKGCFHSKGGKMLSVPLAMMLPLSDTAAEEIANAKTVATASAAKKRKKPSSKQAARDIEDGAESESDGKVLLEALSEDTQKMLLGMTSLDTMQVYCSGKIAVECVRRLFRHMHPANMAELWLRVLEMVEATVQLWKVCRRLSEPSDELCMSVEIASMYAIELLMFALTHSNGRGLSAEAVSEALAPQIITHAMNLLDNCLDDTALGEDNVMVKSVRLATRARYLFCSLWVKFSGHQSLMRRVRHTVNLALSVSTSSSRGSKWATLGVEIMHGELFAKLPRSITSAYLLKPLLGAILAMHSDSSGQKGDGVVSTTSWVALFHGVLNHYSDNRQRADGSGGMRANAEEVMSSAEHSGDDDGMSEDEAGDAIASKSTASGSALLLSCSSELSVLFEACVDLLMVDSNALVDADSIESRMRAALCLGWAADVSPQLLMESDMSDKVCELATHTTRVLIPGLLGGSESRKHRTNQLLLGQLTQSLCAVCAMWNNRTAVPADIKTVKAYIANDLIKSLVDSISRTSNSIMLLWALLGALELSICPSIQLTDRPDLRLVLTGILGHKRESSLLTSMTEALVSPSHWMRVCALRVLYFLPPPAVVQQKASVVKDKEAASSASGMGDGGDLDDEPETSERRVLDVVSLCLQAVCVPASIRQEREYVRHLGQLEVYVASSNLPAEYMRLVCSFCLGMVHFKFQPLWEPAVNVLVSAVNTDDGKEVVWPLILNSIQRLSYKDEDIITDDPESFGATEVMNIDSGEQMVSPAFAYSTVFMFAVPRNRDNAVVDPDSRADVHTALNTVWNILQKSPAITLGNSRVVVPMFWR